MLDLEHRTGYFIETFQLSELVFRIHNHGTELENLKHPFVQAYSFLNEKHRPPRRHLDQNGGQYHYRGEKQKRRSGEDYVEDPLDQDRPSVSWACVMRDESRIIELLCHRPRSLAIEQVREQAHGDALLLAHLRDPGGVLVKRANGQGYHYFVHYVPPQEHWQTCEIAHQAEARGTQLFHASPFVIRET